MKLRDDAGYETTRRALRVLALRLSGRPDAADIQAEVASALGQLKVAEEALQDLIDEVVACSSEIRYLDDLVDRDVADVVRQVLVVTKGDRKSPVYLAVFASAPSEATGGVADENQNRYVHAVLEAKDAQPELAGVDTATLRVDQTVLESALSDRITKQASRDVARAHRDRLLTAAREVHNQAEYRLHLLYPGQRTLVRSFFYERPKKEAEEG